MDGRERNAQRKTQNAQRPTRNAQRETQNAERRTRNVEARPEASEYVPERKYDLEDRLLAYATLVVRLVEDMRDTRAAGHVGGQLLRSGTSAFLNHGEAEGAESHRDFVHKLGICSRFALRIARSAFRRES